MRNGLARLYSIAEPQAGYFTTAQAAAAGVMRQYVQHHLAQGRLIRVAHGIYRLQQFPEQPFEDMVVACLWGGPQSAVSHESALAVYALGDSMPAVIHLTAPLGFRGRRRGVLVHHRELAPDELDARERVPVTSPERTLVDIALTQPPHARMLAQEAFARGLTSRRKMLRYANAHPRHSTVIADITGVHA